MPRIVDKEQKRIMILNAAIHVFARKGFVNTKMIDIAKEAQVGKGTIYEYFRSKEEVFAGTFFLVFEDIQNVIKKIRDEITDPIDQLREILSRIVIPFLESENDYAAIMMDYWAEGVRRKNSEMISLLNLNELYDNIREMISSLLKSGAKRGVFRDIDYHHTAAIIMGAIDGVMLQWIIDPDRVNPRHAINMLMEIITKGITKHD
jgi:AcrR family transcriptional regulator